MYPHMSHHKYYLNEEFNLWGRITFSLLGTVHRFLLDPKNMFLILSLSIQRQVRFVK